MCVVRFVWSRISGSDRAVDWSVVCSAGVALKIMRLFRCTDIDGEWWLAADMRLQCYTRDWFG